MSVVSAGYTCGYVCTCCTGKPVEEEIPVENLNILLGIQVIQNNEMQYYPTGTGVSELTTQAGRMVVLNLGGAQSSQAPPPYVAANVQPATK